MQFAVLTLFPEMFSAVREHGVIGRALNAGLASLELVNPRDFTTDKHRTVDDRPYGGGPGMVMKAQPLSDALSEAKRRIGGSHKVVYLTPQGRRVGQNDIVAAAQTAGLILVAGRYEGVDERFIDADVDEEWSIGDYVVSGGELPAMLMIDAIVRQLPGALGDDESAQQDSFMVASAGIDGGNNKGNAMLGLLDCPHYTRPEAVDGASVPAVLLSGDHAGIARWREMQQIGRTVSRRPDLLPRDGLNEKQRKLLAEFDAEEAEKTGRE